MMMNRRASSRGTISYGNVNGKRVYRSYVKKIRSKLLLGGRNHNKHGRDDIVLNTSAETLSVGEKTVDVERRKEILRRANGQGRGTIRHASSSDDGSSTSSSMSKRMYGGLRDSQSISIDSGFMLNDTGEVVPFDGCYVDVSHCEQKGVQEETAVEATCDVEPCEKSVKDDNEKPQEKEESIPDEEPIDEALAAAMAAASVAKIKELASAPMNLRSINHFDTFQDLAEALMENRTACQKIIDKRVFPVKDVEDYADGGARVVPKRALDPSFDWVEEQLDQESSIEQTLEEELHRLRILRSYLVVDVAREPTFDRLASLACRVFDVPIALVSLIDIGRQFFLAGHGVGDMYEYPRKNSFCSHAILATQDILIVPDAKRDDRFKDIPLVTGPPYIRYYSGVPLVCPEGVKLGTFCLLDVKPHPNGLTAAEKMSLREFAELAVDRLVERRHYKRLIGAEKGATMTDVVGTDSTASSTTPSLEPISEASVVQINLNALLQRMDELMEPIPKMVPVYVTVDKALSKEDASYDEMILDCAVEYLTNACKHTEEGWVHLKITKRDDDNVLFQVEDTGRGIDPKMKDTIFATTSFESDRGGLSRVVSTMNQLEGDCGVSEHESGGSVFWFSVPFLAPQMVEPEVIPTEDAIPTEEQPSTEVKRAPLASKALLRAQRKKRSCSIVSSVSGSDSSYGSASSSSYTCGETNDFYRSPSKPIAEPTKASLVKSLVCGGTWDDRRNAIDLDETGSYSSGSSYSSSTISSSSSMSSEYWSLSSSSTSSSFTDDASCTIQHKNNKSN